MSYRRQLSTAGACVMAVFASALLIGGALPLYGAMTVFSPLILLLTCGMTVKGLLAYPWRRKLRLIQPSAGMLAAWALALPSTALLEPLAALAVRALPPKTWNWGLYPEHVEFTSRYAGIGALVVLASLVIGVRQYVLTPSEAEFEGELPKKNPLLALMICGATFFSLALFIGSTCTAALAIDLLARRASTTAGHTAAWIAAGIASLPALVVGLACLRRGLWMLELRAFVDDHPRSSVRAAATGLVEFHGKARPLDAGREGPILLARDFTAPGEKRRVSDFLLDDGTGAVRVRVPKDARPGQDGTIDLVTRSRTAGLQPEYVLMPGDDVYVLGHFEPSAEGPGSVEPWTPSYGGLFVPLTKELFDQDFTTNMGVDFAELLDLKISAEIFSVSDDGEPRLRRRLGRRAAWSFGLAGVVLAGAAAYLLRLG